MYCTFDYRTEAPKDLKEGKKLAMTSQKMNKIKKKEGNTAEPKNLKTKKKKKKIKLEANC